MRIISGKYKGKRLLAPKKLPVRPTTDMAKEGLFNILNNRYHFDELDILDLFSGTGNISYEFASRGAKSVTAVDINKGCVQFISQTAKAHDFSIKTIKMDVFNFLKRHKIQYEIIFADPPYDFGETDFIRIPNLVFENRLLREDGLLIVEHSSQTVLESHNNFREKRKYGNSVFTFFDYNNG